MNNNDGQAFLDVCGKKIYDYALECFSRFSRNSDTVRLRAFGSNISRAAVLAGLVQENLGAVLADSVIEPVSLFGCRTTGMELTLRLQAPLSFSDSDHRSIIGDGFVPYPVYHLLLDWLLWQDEKVVVRNSDGNELYSIIDGDEGLKVYKTLFKKAKPDYDRLKQALYRTGMILPDNWRSIAGKISQFDDAVIGLDTNILYNCTISEHLIPALSLINPRECFNTPNWILLVIPRAAVHELEESANIRDSRGGLEHEGRMGFRALQEVLELSHCADIAGVCVFIVGDANPILDTKIELQGLRRDIPHLEKRIERKISEEMKRMFDKSLSSRADAGVSSNQDNKSRSAHARSSSPPVYRPRKVSTGDMIIRDQFKNFLRRIDFHKGVFFLTADKSCSAVACTESLNSLYVDFPDRFFDRTTLFDGKIKLNRDDDYLRLSPPIGKLIYETAVQFGGLIIDYKNNSMTIRCDHKGGYLDNWLLRKLKFTGKGFDNLWDDYDGAVSRTKMLDSWKKTLRHSGLTADLLTK